MVWLRILGCLVAIASSGCVVMTPSVSMTALEMASITATNAASIAPATPADSVVHAYERLSSVCIQLNRDAAVADFVPALQAEFAKNGVESHVYDVVPAECHYAVYYTARVAWDQRLFASEYTAYMSSARIELRENGRILAASSYQPSVLNYDKWSSTRDKLAPSVRVLVFGTANGKPPQPAMESKGASTLDPKRPVLIDLDARR